MSAQDIKMQPTTVITTATASASRNATPRPLSIETPTSLYRSRFPEVQSPQTTELQRERIRNLRMSTLTDAAICLSVLGLSGILAFLFFTNRLFIKI